MCSIPVGMTIVIGPHKFSLQATLDHHAPPWMFLPLDIFFEYWIEHVTLGLIYAMFRCSVRIFYGVVPGFATDCPCSVWCRALTTGLMYVGPFLEI